MKRKVYTQDEINAMSEKKIMKLFEQERINDDQVERWHEYQEEVHYLVQEFIKWEL